MASLITRLLSHQHQAGQKPTAKAPHPTPPLSWAQALPEQKLLHPPAHVWPFHGAHSMQADALIFERDTCTDNAERSELQETGTGGPGVVGRSYSPHRLSPTNPASKAREVTVEMTPTKE